VGQGGPTWHSSTTFGGIYSRCRQRTPGEPSAVGRCMVLNGISWSDSGGRPGWLLKSRPLGSEGANRTPSEPAVHAPCTLSHTASKLAARLSAQESRGWDAVAGRPAAGCVVAARPPRLVPHRTSRGGSSQSATIRCSCVVSNGCGHQAAAPHTAGRALEVLASWIQSLRANRPPERATQPATAG